MATSLKNRRFYLKMAGVCLLVLVTVGGFVLYHRVLLFPQKGQVLKRGPKADSTSPGAGGPAGKRWERSAKNLEKDAIAEIIRPHVDERGQVIFPPTSDADAEMNLAPSLVAGIPAEGAYAAVSLASADATKNEATFQQDRENWYRNQFLSEYERVGHRSSSWDGLVKAFLSESARRVSITRYQRHRSSLFFHDNFDVSHAEDGSSILDLGCKDALVQAMLIEELLLQQRHDEARASAVVLKTCENISTYAELIQYQIHRMLLMADQQLELRDEMMHHFRRSLMTSAMTPLERRIHYEEGQTLFAPAHRSVIGKFIVLLEHDEAVDAWLKHMLSGDFYSQLALDADALSYLWPPYIQIYNENPQEALRIHHGHLQKSYRLYLTAFRLAPELPDAAFMLFRMSTSQSLAAFGQGRHDRLSSASPRYWFDQVVTAQCDYRPMYRLYRASLIPPPQAGKRDVRRYARLIEFGLECLNSELFSTQIPFGFHEAIQTVIQGNEYISGPPSPFSRSTHSSVGLIKAYTMMIDGYSDHLTKSERLYFDSLMAGINWIQGHREEAQHLFEALCPEIDHTAFRELYLDIAEMRRGFAESRTDSAVRFNRSEIQGIRVLPANRQLLFSLNSGVYRTWDLESKQALGEQSLLPNEAGEFIPNSLSESGQFIASYRHPVLKICDTKSFSEVASLNFPEQLKIFGVSRTGRFVAVAVGERVELWETSPQRRIAEIDVHVGEESWRGIEWKPQLEYVRGFTFSEGDTMFAFVQGAMIEKFPTEVGWSHEEAPFLVNRLHVWDLQKNEIVCDDQPFVPNITSLRFTDVGEELLVAGTHWSRFQRARGYLPEIEEQHSIRQINPRTTETVQEYVGRSNPLWVPTQFGKDRSLVVALAGRELMVWDAKSGAEVTTVESHNRDVDFLMASQELNRIFSLDSSGVLNTFPEEFDPSVRPVFLTPELYENHAPHRISFHPSTKRVAVCNQNTGGLIWDFSKSPAIGRAYRASGRVGTTALDFSPDLQQLATTEVAMPGVEVVPELQQKAPISIWDTAAGKVVRVLKGETSVIECAKFDPDGKFILAGLRDGNILVWDLQSESELPCVTLKKHLAAVTRLEFSPDRRFLISGGQSGEAFGKPFSPSVRLWEVSEQNPQLKLVRTLELDRNNLDPFGVQNVAMSTDGKWILATHGAVTSLFSFDGKLSCHLEGNKAMFLPDISGIITAGGVNMVDKAVMWDLNGKRVREFEGGHRRPIASIAFAPDGDTFLSASYTEGIATWRAGSGERLLYVSDLFP